MRQFAIFLLLTITLATVSAGIGYEVSSWQDELFGRMNRVLAGQPD